jgi:hypothetical protein
MENIMLAKLALKQIDTFPDTFRMSCWGRKSDCGTVACIAGHVLLQDGRYELNREYYTRPGGRLVLKPGQEAQLILGMSDAERYLDPDDKDAMATGSSNANDIFYDFIHGLDRFRALAEGK